MRMGMHMLVDYLPNIFMCLVTPKVFDNVKQSIFQEATTFGDDLVYEVCWCYEQEWEFGEGTDIP